VAGRLLSFAYSTELFPTEIRGFAQGLATTVSRIGAVLGVLLFPIISQRGLTYGTLFFVVFIALAFALSYVLAPETRQLPLDETSSIEQHRT